MPTCFNAPTGTAEVSARWFRRLRPRGVATAHRGVRTPGCEGDPLLGEEDRPGEDEDAARGGSDAQVEDAVGEGSVTILNTNYIL